MKRFVLFLLVAATLAAHAQGFVCGKVEAGLVQLTAASLYSVTTPGFDLNTVPEVQANSCSSDKPFFFSLAAPEGSYRVTVVLGGDRGATTTVWAEARRLMLEKVPTKPGGSASLVFDINVRMPEIAGDTMHRVKLKPREIGNLDWDNKLTLEFNGDHPSFRSIRIEPIKKPVPPLTSRKLGCVRSMPMSASPTSTFFPWWPAVFADVAPTKPARCRAIDARAATLRSEALDERLRTPRWPRALPRCGRCQARALVAPATLR